MKSLSQLFIVETGLIKNNLALLQYKNETPEQEIHRLKSELKKAQMERDILKKSTLYCQSTMIIILTMHSKLDKYNIFFQ
jgi:transposase-like protein